MRKALYSQRYLLIYLVLLKISLHIFPKGNIFIFLSWSRNYFDFFQGLKKRKSLISSTPLSVFLWVFSQRQHCHRGVRFRGSFILILVLINKAISGAAPATCHSLPAPLLSGGVAGCRCNLITKTKCSPGCPGGNLHDLAQTIGQLALPALLALLTLFLRRRQWSASQQQRQQRRGVTALVIYLCAAVKYDFVFVTRYSLRLCFKPSFCLPRNVKIKQGH